MMSSSLLHLNFQIRKAHSDIIIRKRQEAPLWMCLSLVCIFRRGRAIMVVISMFMGHGRFMFLHLQISFMIFSHTCHWGGPGCWIEWSGALYDLVCRGDAASKY